MKHLIKIITNGEFVILSSGVYQEKAEAMVVVLKRRNKAFTLGMTFQEFKKFIIDVFENMNEQSRIFLGIPEEKVVLIKERIELDRMNGSDLVWEEVMSEFDITYPLDAEQWNLEHASSYLIFQFKKFCSEKLGFKRKSIVLEILFPFINRVQCELEFSSVDEITVQDIKKLMRNFKMNGAKIISVSELKDESYFS